MANFCPKCGGKANPDDRFCKNCGATLASPVEVPKGELGPEKPLATIQAPTKPSGPAWTHTITNIFGVLIGLGIVFLVLYSLGCAMGMFPDTEDQMCQSIRQALSNGISGGHAYGARCTGGDGETGLYGTDGACYTCSKGTAATNPINNNCSEGVAGVYCCVAGTTGGTSGGGTSGGGSTGCIPTGCGSMWYCAGSYWVEGVQISVPGLCFPIHPREIYQGWTGTCRQCP